MPHTPGKLVLKQSRSDGKTIRLTGEAADYFVNLDCDVDSDDKDRNTAEANAQRLAHCWNMHDELVAALEAVVNAPYSSHWKEKRGEISSCNPADDERAERFEINLDSEDLFAIRATLARAKGSNT